MSYREKNFCFLLGEQRPATEQLTILFLSETSDSFNYQWDIPDIPQRNYMNLFILLFFLTLFQQESVTTPKASDVTVNTVEAKVKPTKLGAEMTLTNFGEADSGMFKGLVVVDEIRPSSSYVVEVDIRNPFDQTISFETVQVSCNCGNVEFTDNHILAGETHKAIVTFKTPPRSMTNQFGVTLTLFRDRKMLDMAAVLDVRGNMWGNLSIDHSKSVFSVSEKDPQFSVLINYSKPIKLKNIEINKTGSIADLPVELKEKNGVAFLKFSAIPEVVGEDGISGRVTLSEKRSGASDFFDIIVKKEDDCVCSPRIVRFRRKPSSGIKTSACQGHVIVQIPPSQNNDSDVETSSSDVRFSIASCSLGEESVQAIAKKLSSRVYRVILAAEQDDLRKNQSKKIELTLSWKSNGNVKTKTFALPFKLRP